MKILILLLTFIPQYLFAQQPTNIIYIMSDDHDADAISAYNKSFVITPNIDRLAKEGILFKKAFVGNSICSPARATLLTGQHSHKNSIKDNRTSFDTNKITLPKLLQDAGYQTAIVGKWHLHSKPSGFNYFKVLPGQGDYYRTRFLEMNGDTSAQEGYATEMITDAAIKWLNQRDKNKPFLLLLHHKAPHRNWIPRLKFLEITSKQVFPEPPTLYSNMDEHATAWKEQKMSILYDMTLCSDLKVDPELIKDFEGLDVSKSDMDGYNWTMNRIPEEERNGLKRIFEHRAQLVRTFHLNKKELLRLKYQWYMQDYMACVASIDENIGRILDYLDKHQLSRNTLVMYTGDQGFYLGENGWFDKRWAYDVSMQAPLLARWPGKIKAGTVTNELVQNIDFAPTILDVAAQKIPDWMQGLSLKNLMSVPGTTLKRKHLYYHYYEYPIDHYVLPHIAVRGEQYKLIYFYTINEWEFFDLTKDPAEQKNLINAADQASRIKEYKKILTQLRNQYDDHEKAGELE